MTENPKGTILIIDDDKDQVLALSAFLKGSGFSVVSAYDAVYGIMFAHKKGVDAVVLDMGLPGGGGEYVLENLKKTPRTCDLPIVVLTAKVDPGLPEKLKVKGAAAFFLKPVDPEKLLETLRGITG